MTVAHTKGDTYDEKFSDVCSSSPDVINVDLVDLAVGHVVNDWQADILLQLSHRDRKQHAAFIDIVKGKQLHRNIPKSNAERTP